MTLPRRIKPPKAGISHYPIREWPRHRRWVKGHACCVPGCPCTDIEFSHNRTAANSGTGLKPADWHGISLCSMHHRECHQRGHETMGRIWGIDMTALAAEFAAKSPDIAMREEMRRTV